MRVLLDTNILLRATTRPGGPAHEVLRRLFPSHVLILSEFILEELSRALRYDHMRAIHHLDDQTIARIIGDLRAESDLQTLPPVTIQPVVASDPDDDLIIATAIAGQAEVLCTLDRHLRHPDVQDYCARHGIRVLTDVELLQLLREEDPETSE